MTMRDTLSRAALGLALMGCLHGSAAPASGQGQIQPPVLGGPGGWLGDGAAQVGVVRPSTLTWFLATPGACPSGFTSAANSDGLPLCYAQFGLPGIDSIMTGYRGEQHVTEAAVARLSESRLYFQPAAGVCPPGANAAGRLPSGHPFCWQPIVARTGMMPLVMGGSSRSTIAAWDPSTLQFVAPMAFNICPQGFRRSGTLCTLAWGHARIVPRPVDIDGDKVGDVGFYDPLTAAHYYVPSQRRCPSGFLANGTVNGVPACRLPAVSGQVPIEPADYDGDRIADALNYDTNTGVFTLAPSSGNCPLSFVGTGRDVFGRSLCAVKVGAPGTDVAIAGGDYDNDGRVDPVALDPVSYVWKIAPSSGLCPATTTPAAVNGTIVCSRQFGLPPDRAIR